MKRNNTLVIQKLWGWKVALHLFLVSAGAGIYICGFLLGILCSGTGFILASKIAIIAAAPLVIAGEAFIFSHLGSKSNALRAFLRPSSSWLARGSILLLVFIILDLLHMGIRVSASASQGVSTLDLMVGIAASIFALLSLFYTGMLLKALKPFAFWNTRLLPILFIIAGISAGVMGLALLVSIYGLLGGRALGKGVMFMVYCNNFLMIIHIVALGCYLGRAYAVRAGRESFFLLTRGVNAAVFWWGVVAAGLAVPLVLGIVLVTRVPELNPVAVQVLTALLTLSGLMGGLLLRYTVLAAGTSIPITVEGEEVPLQESARFPASHRVQY